jgi:hypothetical protein
MMTREMTSETIGLFSLIKYQLSLGQFKDVLTQVFSLHVKTDANDIEIKEPDRD